jgi:hypothetical protein
VTLGTDGSQFTGYHNAIILARWNYRVGDVATCGRVVFVRDWKRRPIFGRRRDVDDERPVVFAIGTIRTGEDWKGYIDDLRMYPTAVSDQACVDLYAYETALTSDTPITANTYVCHDVGVQFGSNVFPTTSSPGGYTIDSYGPIVFRETPRVTRSVVTPWFIQGTKYFVVTPYPVALDYSFAAWIYDIDGTILFNNPSLTIGTNGTTLRACTTARRSSSGRRTRVRHGRTSVDR